MILKWLQNRVRLNPPRQTEPVTLPSKLLDIAHEVLAREAAEKQQAFRQVEKYGWQQARLKAFHQRVKNRVRRLLGLSTASAAEEEELLDEVTEKITEAAEADPHYKRLFGGADASE